MTLTTAARVALVVLAGSVLALESVAADSLTPQREKVPGGTSIPVTLLLDRAPATNTSFAIALSGTNRASANSTILIRAGQVKESFVLTTAATLNQDTVEIAVGDPHTGNVVARTRLVVTPAVLTTLALNKSAVVGGTSGSAVTGTVTLDGLAAAPGPTIALGQACSNCQQGSQSTGTNREGQQTPTLTLPPSVQIPSGSRSATFTIESPRVQSTTQFSVLASQGTVVKSASLEDSPLRPLSMSLSPATVSGAQPTTVTITLNAPAYNGYTLQLSFTQSLASDLSASTSGCSSSIDRTRAPCLVVPAGQSSVSFHLHNSQLSAPTQVTIEAEGQIGGKVQATLTIAP